MTTKNIIIIGAGGHARSITDVVESDGDFQIHGFVDSNLNIGDKFCGYDVIGSDDDLSDILPHAENALIGIGQISNPNIRQNLFQLLKEKGFKLPAISSPSSIISVNSFVGQGTIIMHGAIVNSGAKIGENCIINTGSIIEHDVEVGDNTHISTGVIVNGSSKVGKSSFIGSGSVIRNNINIGERCLVGMGSKVLNDLPDFAEHKD